MIFKTHEKNIPQIRAALRVYAEVWVHGSGDIFPVFVYNPDFPFEQDHSKNMAEHFNKGQEENSYRVKINLQNMPKNKADLDMMLRRAKDQETILKRQPIQGDGKVRNIVVKDEDVFEPVGEIDYSALEQYSRNPENIEANPTKKTKKTEK